MAEAVTKIICPHCKREIPLDEALTHQIKEKLQQEFNQELNKREAELKVRQEALKKKEEELERLKKAQADELVKMRSNMEKEFLDRLEAEKKKAEEAIKKRLAEETQMEIMSLKEELAEKANRIKEFQALEINLRQEKRRLEEEKENLELEITRRLDSERQKLKEEMQRKIEEEHKLKDLEKDKLIETLKNQIEELKRKAEQGSQQLQGEVLELELEELLKRHFPHDQISPVPKGFRGADVIQVVCTQGGQRCGTILWESKRTKAWNHEWIDKLKEDQREIKAEIAVIVSTALPPGMVGIGQLNGVWISDLKSAYGLAAALRSGLIEIAKVKTSMEGRSEKIEMLYSYLSGPEFRQQIEGIVEAFKAMRNDLDAEKRAMEKIWAKREKQIERMVKNTARIYGSLQGIIGSTLPELSSLSLAALALTQERNVPQIES